MFQKYPTILQNPEAKKVIKNYNKLAKVLLEFELLYHQAWKQQVKRMVKAWTGAPLINKQDTSGSRITQADIL